MNTPSPIYRTLSQEEFDDLTARILYEDNHLLVANACRKRSRPISPSETANPDKCLWAYPTVWTDR